MKVIIDIPENATIREILEATLKATDYNGLRGDECGCLEGDLLLCNGGCDGLIDPDCQLGYVHWCKDCTKKTDCETYDEVKDCDPSVHCCVKLDKQKKETLQRRRFREGLERACSDIDKKKNKEFLSE